MTPGWLFGAQVLVGIIGREEVVAPIYRTTEVDLVWGSLTIPDQVCLVIICTEFLHFVEP